MIARRNEGARACGARRPGAALVGRRPRRRAAAPSAADVPRCARAAVACAEGGRRTGEPLQPLTRRAIRVFRWVPYCRPRRTARRNASQHRARSTGARDPYRAAARRTHGWAAARSGRRRTVGRLSSTAGGQTLGRGEGGYDVVAALGEVGPAVAVDRNHPAGAEDRGGLGGLSTRCRRRLDTRLSPDAHSDDRKPAFVASVTARSWVPPAAQKRLSAATVSSAPVRANTPAAPAPDQADAPLGDSRGCVPAPQASDGPRKMVAITTIDGATSVPTLATAMGRRARAALGTPDRRNQLRGGAGRVACIDEPVDGGHAAVEAATVAWHQGKRDQAPPALADIGRLEDGDVTEPFPVTAPPVLLIMWCGRVGGGAGRGRRR